MCHGGVRARLTSSTSVDSILALTLVMALPILRHSLHVERLSDASEDILSLDLEPALIFGDKAVSSRQHSSSLPKFGASLPIVPATVTREVIEPHQPKLR